jgi:hypothetical protein
MLMLNVMRRGVGVILCAALAVSGCATTRVVQVSPAPSGDRLADRAVMAEYVQKLPTGATIKVERTHRRTMRGVLMKATDQAVFVQPRTRLPEPALEIPLDDVLSVTLETSHGNSIGRSIAAGAAAGAGVVLSMLLISLALWSD